MLYTQSIKTVISKGHQPLKKLAEICSENNFKENLCFFSTVVIAALVFTLFVLNPYVRLFVRLCISNVVFLSFATTSDGINEAMNILTDLYIKIK